MWATSRRVTYPLAGPISASPVSVRPAHHDACCQREVGCPRRASVRTART